MPRWATYNAATSGSSARKFVCPSCMSRMTGSHQHATISAIAEAVSRAPDRDTIPAASANTSSASGSFRQTQANCAAGLDSVVNGASASRLSGGVGN